MATALTILVMIVIVLAIIFIPLWFYRIPIMLWGFDPLDVDDDNIDWLAGIAYIVIITIILLITLLVVGCLISFASYFHSLF